MSKPVKRTNSATRKITVNVPADLIDYLQTTSGEGLTQMMQRLMEEEKRRLAWKKLGQLFGKVKFSLTYDEMKEDRE